jgi:hypothetical protein
MSLHLAFGVLTLCVWRNYFVLFFRWRELTAVVGVKQLKLLQIPLLAAVTTQRQ